MMARLNRRTFISRATAGAAALTTIRTGRSGLSNSIVARATKENAQAAAAGLAEPAFAPLPLGAVTPAGWLRRQLRIQADGLSGHLDEFWPDVGRSQWFGGTAEGWERAPYWLDGAIPLAWLVDDQPLKARITRYMAHIVSSQRA